MADTKTKIELYQAKIAEAEKIKEEAKKEYKDEYHSLIEQITTLENEYKQLFNEEIGFFKKGNNAKTISSDYSDTELKLVIKAVEQGLKDGGAVKAQYFKDSPRRSNSIQKIMAIYNALDIKSLDELKKTIKAQAK
jgi:hypothetical protein